MKFLTSWMAIISVLFTSVPHAGAAQASNHARVHVAIEGLTSQSAILRLAMGDFSTSELRQKIETAAHDKPKEALVGVGHTLLFMMVLAGLDMTAQEIHKSGVQAVSPSHLAQIIQTVSKTILDSPQIWTSIFASGGLSLAQKPALELARVLLQPALKSAFLPVLAHTISSTIAFVGWEFGSQLYTEATLLLESKQDFEIASSASSMARGVYGVAVASRARTASAADQNGARVARLMLQNMTRILLYDSKLRNEWFYNTMRLHIMTGGFATLLTAMIASGAIGTMIFPGGGTLVGLIFGLIGGVISMFIPQKNKDQITWGFQSVRKEALWFMLFRNKNRLTYEINLNSMHPDDFKNGFADDLIARHGLRSRLATIEFERLMTDFKTNGYLKDAKSSFANIKEIYAREFKVLSDIRALDTKITSQPYYATLLNREVVRCRSMLEFMQALLEEATANPKSDDLLKYIEASEARGFDETPAVQMWLESTSADQNAS